MNTDIRLSVDFLQNIKVRKLKKSLGADGVLALIALWTYCAKNYPTGELGKFSEDIELIAEWDGQEGLFLETIKTLNLIDENENGEYTIHDWEENNPYTAYSQERSDAGRLAKLKQDNPKVAKHFIDQGRSGITKEEYNKAKYGVTGAQPNYIPKVTQLTLQGIPQGNPEGYPVGTPGGEPRDTLCTNSNTNTNTNNKVKTVEASRTRARAVGGGQKILLDELSCEEQEIVDLFLGLKGLPAFDTYRLVDQLRKLLGEFPGVLLKPECEKMALWLEANPKKKRNLLLFIRNWIERASSGPPGARPQDAKWGSLRDDPNPNGTVGKLSAEEEAHQEALAERFRDVT